MCKKDDTKNKVDRKKSLIYEEMNGKDDDK